MHAELSKGKWAFIPHSDVRVRHGHEEGALRVPAHDMSSMRSPGKELIATAGRHVSPAGLPHVGVETAAAA